MEKMATEQLVFYILCQSVHKKPKSRPVKPTDIPKKVRQTVHMDYVGPFLNGKNTLVLIDKRSMFLVVVFTDIAGAKHFKAIFGMTFSHFRYPEELVSNSGQPFRSEEIKRYILKLAIKHRHVTPYWPRANDEIERFMKPLTKVIITAKLENKPHLSEVDNFLMAYRVAPPTTTKVPPSEVMFNRKIRYTTPSVDDIIGNKVHNILDKKY